MPLHQLDVICADVHSSHHRSGPPDGASKTDTHDFVVIVLTHVQAESITEGTLKQFTKQVGDFVNADEEIATIETDKVSA